MILFGTSVDGGALGTVVVFTVCRKILLVNFKDLYQGFRMSFSSLFTSFRNFYTILITQTP